MTEHTDEARAAAVARAGAEAAFSVVEDDAIMTYGLSDAEIARSFFTDGYESGRAAAQAEGIYVPGEWECPKCRFTLQKNFLHAGDGTVSTNNEEVREVCPNDGATLRRQTWESRAQMAEKLALEEMKRDDAAQAEGADIASRLNNLEARYIEVYSAGVEFLRRWERLWVTEEQRALMAQSTNRFRDALANDSARGAIERSNPDD